MTNPPRTRGEKLGLLLVNTGTPQAPTPEAVRDYLARFLTDPRIAPMPLPIWKIILKTRVLGARSVASAKKYQAIWTDEGSPLDRVHRALARGIQDCLGDDVVVAVAMSYSSPLVDEGLAALAAEGVERIVVLPLYPQSAHSTTGAVKDKVAAALDQIAVPVEIIDNYHANPRYIDALAASVMRAGFDPDGDDLLVASFHSIPLKDVRAGDTYVEQTKATSELLRAALGLEPDRLKVLYQSRFDRGRVWQGPFLRETLAQWAAQPLNGALYVICPNFSVDCLETLNEIQNELLPAFLAADAEAGGKATAIYIPCLNASDDAIEVIASVLAAVRERGVDDV